MSINNTTTTFLLCLILNFGGFQSHAQSPISTPEPSSVTADLNSLNQENEKQLEARKKELDRLEEDRARLEKQLGATVAEIKKVQNVVTTNQNPVDIILTTEKIHEILTKKSFGSCVVQQGEHDLEFIITRGEKKIRVVFLEKTDSLAPKASFTKNSWGVNLVEIQQPPYDPKSINQSGDMSVTIRYKVETEEIVHAVFNGQSIDDKNFLSKWVSGTSSSFTSDTISCVL